MAAFSSNEQSDQVLVTAVGSGSSAAFELLYGRYRDWVVRLAYRFTGNQDDALEVFQETFMYLLRRSPGLELKGRLTTFLYPAVRHLARDARHRLGRFRSGEEVLANVTAPACRLATDGLGELGRKVDALPARQREVLLMRFVDDLELQEIADVLGIPLGTVQSRLHRALAAVGRKIESRSPTVPGRIPV